MFAFSELASQTREIFSGKDSGKGDSDFNDSDSDISGIGLSKRNALNPKQNGEPIIDSTNSADLGIQCSFEQEYSYKMENH